MSKGQQLELKDAHAATIANLAEITNDPIDAMRLAADLYAMSAYRAERAIAVRAGLGGPRAPKTLSNYMRTFMKSLKAKLSAVVGMFDTGELARLKKLAPAIAVRLERNDPELAEDVMWLVCMTPDDAVAWIREHLDEIEARFAS